MKSTLRSLSLLAFLMIGPVVHGQTVEKLTEADYQRATAMLSGNVSKLVDNAIRPQWLPDNRLWYKSATEDQEVYKLFDPAKGKMLKAESRKELFEKASVDAAASRRGSRRESKSPDGKYVLGIGIHTPFGQGNEWSENGMFKMGQGRGEMFGHRP